MALPRGRRRPLPAVALSITLAITFGLAGCASSAEESSAQPGAAPSGDPSASAVTPSTGTPSNSPAATAPASGSPSQPATASPPASTAPAVRDIVVSITGGQVQPTPGNIEVSAGERVRITVTSDVADELHVHGFGEPEAELSPGVPASVEIVAEPPGVYAVETHESGLTLFQLLVR